MNAQQSVIRHSELIDRLVLDRRTAEEVGRVDYLWLNPQFHQVVGFTCKSGLLGGKKRSFAWADIDSIGADGILVNAIEGEEPQKPEHILSLIGHEVWTDTGNKVGKLVDYLLIPQTRAVVGYLFMSGGWRGILEGVYLLPVTDISNIGSKRVIVPDGVVQNPQLYAEGLNQKVTQVTGFIKEDLDKTRHDLEVMKRGAQDIAGQVKGKVQGVTDKAKEEISPNKDDRLDTSLPPAVETIEIKAELISEESKEQ